MSQYVIGIDPSLSATAVCCLNERGELVGNVVCPSKPPPMLSLTLRIRRALDLASSVSKIIRVLTEHPERIAAIGIEGYACGVNTSGVLERAEYGGLLRSMLLTYGCQLYEIPPTVVKKWACNSGGAKKVEVAQCLTRDFGVMFKTDDECDAYAVARMTLQAVGLQQDAAKYRQAAIETVRGGTERARKKRRTA